MIADAPAASDKLAMPGCAFANKKGPARRPTPSFTWPAAVRTTPPARAELAHTRRTMTLVIAPEEHPVEIGLGSKREARGEPTGKHATPWTEALHVPLHLERGCWAASGRPPYAGQP